MRDRKQRIFFFDKNKKIKNMQGFAEFKIKLKFNSPQGKIRMSGLPDSIILLLKREKYILCSFVI